MAQHKRNVHGHTVIGDDNAVKGMNYLDYDLDYQESEVFFQQAKMYGQVKFEDDQDRDYTLRYNRDGTYTLEFRKKSSGFFSGWF